MRDISLATPILCSAFKTVIPLTRFDRKTLYTPGAAGYTSYTHLTPL
jgi:hypothetical protein